MKLVSFKQGGKASYGAVMGEKIADFGAVAGAKAPDLKSAIAQNLLADLAKSAKPGPALAAVELLPVIPNPDKIFCVGLNYEAHRIETGRPVAKYPMIFPRFAETQVAHGEPMIAPIASKDFDYEGELVVIMGKRGRRIAEKDALSHVAGYSIYNEGSIRDFQFHASQYTPGKNFIGTGAFGPWMVTADEIADPNSLTLVTRLNGVEVQRTETSDMIFKIPFLISYLSSFIPLGPGDVIVSGTPGGVGFVRKPPLFMKGGDTVEVEISKIGTLQNPVVAEQA